MAYPYEYPYTDPNRHNDDWVIGKIKDLIEEMTNFTITHHIKFADPIEWNPARYYPIYTVVLDSETQDTYLSKTNVPAGIPLSDRNYWFKIANFNAQLQILSDKIDNLPIITPEDCGAVGDGQTDDTTAIQTALDSGKIVVFRNKTYAITKTLHVSDNTLVLLNKATIQTLGLHPIHMMYIEDCENVTVSGGTFSNIYTNVDDGSESSNFEIYIGSSRNITIEGTRFVNNKSDGIYCGYMYFYDGKDRFRTSDINIRDCYFNTKRNGVSLVSGNNVTISDCTFDRINKFAPHSAVDIEAESGSNHNLHFDNINIVNNIVIDCTLNVVNYTGTESNIVNCNISNNTITDGAISIYKNNKFAITISNNTVHSPLNPYAVVVNENKVNAPVAITNNTFNECNTAQSDATFYGTVSIITGENTPGGNNYGGVSIVGNNYVKCGMTSIHIANHSSNAILFNNMYVNESIDSGVGNNYIRITNVNLDNSKFNYGRVVNNSTNYYQMQLTNGNILHNYLVAVSDNLIEIDNPCDVNTLYVEFNNNPLNVKLNNGTTFDGKHTTAHLTAGARRERVDFILTHAGTTGIYGNVEVTYS